MAPAAGCRPDSRPGKVVSAACERASGGRFTRGRRAQARRGGLAEARRAPRAAARRSHRSTRALHRHRARGTPTPRAGRRSQHGARTRPRQRARGVRGVAGCAVGAAGQTRELARVERRARDARESRGGPKHPARSPGSAGGETAPQRRRGSSIYLRHAGCRTGRLLAGDGRIPGARTSNQRGGARADPARIYRPGREQGRRGLDESLRTARLALPTDRGWPVGRLPPEEQPARHRPPGGAQGERRRLLPSPGDIDVVARRVRRLPETPRRALRRRLLQGRPVRDLRSPRAHRIRGGLAATAPGGHRGLPEPLRA